MKMPIGIDTHIDIPVIKLVAITNANTSIKAKIQKPFLIISISLFKYKEQYLFENSNKAEILKK